MGGSEEGIDDNVSVNVVVVGAFIQWSWNYSI